MITSTDPLATAYAVRPDEKLAFGRFWTFQGEAFEHNHQHMVAQYPSLDECQEIAVFCEAYPARFYTIKAYAKGDKREFTLATGSGCDELAASIALALSHGMLVLKL